LSIDKDGTPHLKQLATSIQPKGLAEFEQEIRARMPERHLLDILKHAEHWAGYTRHFGPPSGADPKLANATQRYIFTVFGYGCNLGPGQTARHAPEIATAQVLRRINAQHVNADKLEAAMVDVINQYVRFPLPRLWGSGKTAIADGTHVKLRENNLMGSRTSATAAMAASPTTTSQAPTSPCSPASSPVASGRRPYSGCADEEPSEHPARHASRRYPGPKRADLRPVPGSRNQADAAHAWPERRRLLSPGKSIRYKHIDALFGDEIDWDLIATHARDMIQVVLSIQAGRVMPSMLLRKLGTYSRKSLLYRAFRELGRVERTLFLLRYISNTEVRRVIRAETTKIEAYNDFLDWVCFGGPVVKSGDPVEQEKQLKYASLVANAVMLSNVADLTEVLSDMAKDGHAVTRNWSPATLPISESRFAASAGSLSTCSDLPAPLNPQPLPFEDFLHALVTTFYTYPELTPLQMVQRVYPAPFLELWREQHPQAPEQLALCFESLGIVAEPRGLFEPDHV
jgi:TnpA family transposase